MAHGAGISSKLCGFVVTAGQRRATATQEESGGSGKMADSRIADEKRGFSLAIGVAGGRGHPGAPRAADGGATDRAGAKSRLRFYVSGNGSSGGRRRDDVARAEVCRQDDMREVRGLGGVVFPSPARRRRGRGRVRGCGIGLAWPRLRASGATSLARGPAGREGAVDGLERSSIGARAGHVPGTCHRRSATASRFDEVKCRRIHCRTPYFTWHIKCE